MRDYLSQFSLLFVVCLLSCTKQKGADYVPLSDGSKWEYSVEYAAPFIGVQKGRGVSRIDGEETINGKKYYKWINVYFGIPGAEAEVFYYRQTDQGIYALNRKYKDSPEYLVTMFPLEIGNNWTSQTPTGEIRYKVANLETLELIVRTYKDCLRISYNGFYESSPLEGYFFLAKGVGVVKQVVKINGVTLDYTLERW